MTKRKAISKKDRFEMLKRDSFTCQYCGATPPHVVLEPDHIQPVAEGGGNELLNLVTSCFDCNRGKSARLLSDDSVVVKQKKQLDNLQEKREQFKMMYEWRKGLDGLTIEATRMITEYIESKVEPFVLTKSGKKNLEKTINKYDFDDILNAINISESTYLRYGVDDTLEPDSVKNFFSKITGILVNSSRSPLELKISRIKSIGRKQFDNWEPQKGAIVLSKMLKKMRSYPGSSDESILTVLENTIEPMTQDAKTWRQWKWRMEEFLEVLESKTSEGLMDVYDRNLEEHNHKQELLMKKVDSFIEAIEQFFPALMEIGSSLTFRKKLTHWRVCSGVLNYLQCWSECYLEDFENREELPLLEADFSGIGLMPDPELRVASLTSSYHIVLGKLCGRIESIITNDKGQSFLKDFRFKAEDIREDFEFMASHFHSQIEWPFDEMRAETNNAGSNIDGAAALVPPLSQQSDHVDHKKWLRQKVIDIISIIDSAAPALFFAGRSITFKSKLTLAGLYGEAANHVEALKEFNSKPASERGKYPESFMVYDTEKEGLFVSGFLLVLIDVERRIRSDVFFNVDKLTDEDFDFIVNFLHSKVERLIDDEKPDTDIVNYAKDTELGRESLTLIVDGILDAVDVSVPELVSIHQSFDDVEEAYLTKAVSLGIINYLFLCWINIGSTNRPSLFTQFKEIGILSGFNKMQGNNPHWGLLIPFSDVLVDLEETIDGLVSLEETIDGNRVAEIASEEYCFIIELFYKQIGLKLRELLHKKAGSELIEKELEKLEEGSKIIPFPSKD